MSEWRETFWDGHVHINVKINIFLYIFSSPVFKILAVFMLEIPSIIAADNFIWCLVSVQIVDIFYPIMSFQIVLREAVQVGYMQSNDWYTISPSLCTSLSASSI